VRVVDERVHSGVRIVPGLAHAAHHPKVQDQTSASPEGAGHRRATTRSQPGIFPKNDAFTQPHRRLAVSTRGSKGSDAASYETACRTP
jgi:hypothetical protein